VRGKRGTVENKRKEGLVMVKWTPVAVIDNRRFRKDFLDMFLNMVAVYIANDIAGLVDEEGIDLSDAELDKMIRQFFDQDLEKAFKDTLEYDFFSKMIFRDLPANKFYVSGKEVYDEIPDADRRLKPLVVKYLEED
jgi:hypothetical protein